MWCIDLHTIEYNEGFDLQKKLVDLRLAGSIPDTLLLLEHLPVFTANREATFQNILASRTVLEKAGIQVCKTDRGGDVTYHGPGQIVGYLIMDLKQQGRDLHRYIRNVEQMIIDTLLSFEIKAGRDPQHPGVWIGVQKICAIGIAVKSGWITMHGFGLNVQPNMEHYRMIIACGIAGRGVTSMRDVLDTPLNIADVKSSIVTVCQKIFMRKACTMSLEDVPWS